jgi:NTE family protein
VVGTSVGALNGAFVAADPTPQACVRLAALWRQLSADVFSGPLVQRVSTAVRTRTHLHRRDPLRQLLEAHLPVRLIEDLTVPFQCVAASVERAAEHWFTAGSLSDAVLASCAVPGLLAPVELDGEHFLDGGLVNSIPVSRAVALGATTIYVLQVGRIERPLTPPRQPWEVGLVAFEIARRHRFTADMSALPKGVTAHVLPTGEQSPAYNDLRSLRYRDTRRVSTRVENGYTATRRYLSDLATQAATATGA